MTFSFNYIYFPCFLACSFALMYMAIRSYKNIDAYYWTIELFLPLVTIGYLARNLAETKEAIIMANNLVYIDGTFLPAIFLLCAMRTFKVKTPTFLKAIVSLAALAHLLLVWFGSTNGLYYKTVEFINGPYGAYMVYEDGPLKFLHFVFLVPITLGLFVVLIHAFRHPEKCSRLAVLSYFLIGISTLGVYIFDLFKESYYQVVPIVYAIVSWMIAMSYNKNFIHNVDEIVSTVHDTGSLRGYIAFDLRTRFLGANHMAMSIVPDLRYAYLDKVLDAKKVPDAKFFYELIEKFEAGSSEPEFLKIGDKTYKCQVAYFYAKKNESTKGFLLEISDDTSNRNYLEFVSNYNETLTQAIKSQTSNIRAIQAKVVLGLADMIESRDQSTGSHVKRTSDIIQILVDVMKENEIGVLNRIFAEDIIRAAPMHDLGKISIDNSILCKPGKLTDEEYAIMKTHPVKSGEIVHAILKGVEEPHFVSVAYNVARHHHERWDGKGYPDGLAGEKIPLESRVMAIADVYDALVSKRCYKEPMSFKQAYTVMMANMGTQFDPMMETVFVLARPQLETYYKSLEYGQIAEMD